MENFVPPPLVLTDKELDRESHLSRWRFLLSDWIPIWDHLGLSYIPCLSTDQNLGISAQSYLSSEDGGESMTEFISLMSGLNSARKRGEFSCDVIRWDCCSGYSLKSFMERANGDLVVASQNCDSYIHRLSGPDDDERASSIFGDVYAQKGPDFYVRIYKRPIVPMMKIEGYPVEFRVFVEKSQVVGVSSYYPHRPLPNEYRNAARKVAEMTLPMCEYQADFSADWGITRNHEYILIECGPPHDRIGGAHPCCFLSDPTNIRGVALQPVDLSRVPMRVRERYGLFSGIEPQPPLMRATPDRKGKGQ